MKRYSLYLSFPLDGTHLVAVRGFIHQEVLTRVRLLSVGVIAVRPTDLLKYNGKTWVDTD